jgi:ubiquinone/menaquinone biosynthesis C-methylase UbiE
MNSRAAIASPVADAPSTLVDIASLCKAAGDPLRLQILRALRNDSLGVLELCHLLDIRQPALSHHLKVLSASGLVARRREGNFIFYRRAEAPAQDPLARLQQQLFASVDEQPLEADIADRLAGLQRTREENSREFFRRNADKFREQQDLIASYGQYAETVRDVVDAAPLGQRGLALEIGPGDGQFLLELAPRFRRVVAIDNAEAMLASAQTTVAEAELDNVELLLGDTTSPQLEGLSADCIVINMVLHHTPAPEQILRDAAARLAPGGVVVLTDLCRHDQAWARESCGDLWLGFEPEQLQSWAQACGLQDLASTFLAQRNGFQIQVRLFGHPATRKTA